MDRWIRGAGYDEIGLRSGPGTAQSHAMRTSGGAVGDGDGAGLRRDHRRRKGNDDGAERICAERRRRERAIVGLREIGAAADGGNGADGANAESDIAHVGEAPPVAVRWSTRWANCRTTRKRATVAPGVRCRSPVSAALWVTGVTGHGDGTIPRSRSGGSKGDADSATHRSRQRGRAVVGLSKFGAGGDARNQQRVGARVGQGQWQRRTGRTQADGAGIQAGRVEGNRRSQADAAQRHLVRAAGGVVGDEQRAVSTSQPPPGVKVTEIMQLKPVAKVVGQVLVWL